MTEPRRHLRTALIVANLAMLAFPTYAVAGGGGEVAAGLALGCCAGMAGAAMISSAADRRRPPREVHVTEVHHVVDEPSARVLSPAEARAELAEAELWSREHCVATEAQPDEVKVFITFRGGDGRATSAWFEPPLNGADFHACMQRAFSSTRVSPFDTPQATVSKSLGG